MLSNLCKICFKENSWVSSEIWKTWIAKMTHRMAWKERKYRLILSVARPLEILIFQKYNFFQNIFIVNTKTKYRKTNRLTLVIK